MIENNRDQHGFGRFIFVVIKLDKHHHNIQTYPIQIIIATQQKVMNLYLYVKNGIILALATAWPVVVKGDFTLPCPAGQVEVDYCGGNAKTSAVNELSCTPFPLKSKELPPYVPANFCDNEDLAKYAGPNSNYASKVWYDPTESNNPNYWVFHGCDGAGFMDDCAGGQTYVEQFGPWDNKHPHLPMTINDCKNMGDVRWTAHCAQPFWHPGTNKIYEWYNAGQLTFGGGQWPDQRVDKPWFDNMGLHDTDYDVPGIAYVIMYPWVCDQNKVDTKVWSKMWGNNRPYGTKTSQTKCYYDNEPWDNGPNDDGNWAHFNSKLIPPVWQAYKFHNDGHGTITGWMLAEKKEDSPTPFNYQGGTFKFTLKEKTDGPWMAVE